MNYMYDKREIWSEDRYLEAIKFYLCYIKQVSQHKLWDHQHLKTGRIKEFHEEA